MALLGFTEEWRRAAQATPFSNGTEGEAWEAAWCDTCKHNEPEPPGCQLLDVALLGRTPYPWERMAPGSLARKYICHEWISRTSRPEPPAAPSSGCLPM